jgi:hypothetical protein
MAAPNSDSLTYRPPGAATDVAMPVPRIRGIATLSRLRAARPAVTTEAMLLGRRNLPHSRMQRAVVAWAARRSSPWSAINLGICSRSRDRLRQRDIRAAGRRSPRAAVKPLLTLVLLATAVAVHFMGAYGVILDTSMLRNLLHTDFAEARELIGRDIVVAVLAYAAAPIALVWWLRLTRRPPRRAIAHRVLAICGAWVLALAALMPVYRDLASVIRNQPHLRNLLTPENYVFALGRALGQDTHRAALARVPIGEDAHLAAAWKTRTRPVLLVLIVGETARADHFALNGYARDTTPELARLGVVNFPNVTSCGTATEVSLPCMFSSLGRSEYDGDRIRREEGLLNVLARAGLRVVWRDNQSGCKGVCDGKGIEFQSVRHVQLPGLCTSDGCLDEILLKDLEATVASDDRSQVIVMHQLGNHGPAYFSRYPERFRRFVPTCDTPELRHCSREEIVNAYDNALAYTDHVVAETIEFSRPGQTATTPCCCMCPITASRWASMDCTFTACRTRSHRGSRRMFRWWYGCRRSSSAALESTTTACVGSPPIPRAMTISSTRCSDCSTLRQASIEPSRTCFRSVGRHSKSPQAERELEQSNESGAFRQLRCGGHTLETHRISRGRIVCRPLVRADDRFTEAPKTRRAPDVLVDERQREPAAPELLHVRQERLCRDPVEPLSGRSRDLQSGARHPASPECRRIGRCAMNLSTRGETRSVDLAARGRELDRQGVADTTCSTPAVEIEAVAGPDRVHGDVAEGGVSDYSSGTSSSATMLMILISGLIAGPAVSL